MSFKASIQDTIGSPTLHVTDSSGFAMSVTLPREQRAAMARALMRWVFHNGTSDEVATLQADCRELS